MKPNETCNRLIDIPLEQFRYSAFSRYLAAGQLRETAPGQRQGTQSDEDVPAHEVAHQRGDQGSVQRVSSIALPLVVKRNRITTRASNKTMRTIR